MKEFLTFKSGKFYFNEEHDASQIDNLLVRATVLNETIVDLPILPELASRIEWKIENRGQTPVLLKRSCFA